MYRLIAILVIVFMSSSCAKKEVEYEPVKSVDAYALYQEAFKAFEKGDYYYAEKKFSATLLFKNIGRQLNPFAIFNESVPFEIQFALSKELAYLPFRYHLTYNNINNFDIKSPYKLREQTNIDTGQLEIKDESIAKTFLRHVIIGGELNPFRKSLFIRGGFNFQRRFDMSIISRPVMVGFSWGLGFRLSKYYFDYSRFIVTCLSFDFFKGDPIRPSGPDDPIWIFNFWLWIFDLSDWPMTFFFHNSFIFEKNR